MLFVEEIGRWAIIGSHVIIVCTNPLIATEHRLSEHEKREILQKHFRSSVSTLSRVTKVRMSMETY